MNKTFKLSLAALTALGTLSSASAMSFLEALEGTSISSTTFVRYTEKTGLGDAGGRASGSRFQVKSYLNFLTQDFEGYQAGFGLYYNQGSGMPLSESSNSAHKDLLGTGASHLGNGGGIADNLNAFGVSEAFLSKKFDENGKHSAKVGMMYLKTPFTDGTMDRGVGASTAFQLGNTTLKVAAYDTWSSMDWAFMQTLGGYATDGGETPTYRYDPVSLNRFGNNSFKNNLIYIGAEKSAVDGSGLDYKFYLSHISRMVDAAAYLDLGYNTGGFRLGAQVAYTQFGKYSGEYARYSTTKTEADNARTGITGNALVYNIFGDIKDKSSIINPSGDLAKNAGLYNIQASYASKGSFMLKAGFTGSFGDSYGALIDNQGAFNLGGMVWHNMLIYGGNGASMFGSGGVKGTNIMVGYAKFVLDATEKLKLGIDVAYVGGANNIHGNTNNFTSSSLNNKNTNFIEITPSLVYKLNERFTFTSWYGQSVGDMKLHIARAEVKFAF